MFTKNPTTPDQPQTAGQLHDAANRRITESVEAMARAGNAVTRAGKTVLADGTVVERR